MAAKEKIGTVVSDKMDKTIVVAVENRAPHPKYGKIVVKTSRYKVHDQYNSCCVGDEVLIRETRPLSRTKCWAVAEVLRSNASYQVSNSKSSDRDKISSNSDSAKLGLNDGDNYLSMFEDTGRKTITPYVLFSQKPITIQTKVYAMENVQHGYVHPNDPSQSLNQARLLPQRLAHVDITPLERDYTVEEYIEQHPDLDVDELFSLNICEVRRNNHVREFIKDHPELRENPKFLTQILQYIPTLQAVRKPEVVLMTQAQNITNEVLEFCELNSPVDLEITLPVEIPEAVDEFLKYSMGKDLELAKISLDVCITALGFKVEDECQSVTFPASKPAKVSFTIIPQKAGKQVIEIELLKSATRVGYIIVETDVKD
jgi:small subunit ribosomal protein S17